MKYVLNIHLCLILLGNGFLNKNATNFRNSWEKIKEFMLVPSIDVELKFEV